MVKQWQRLFFESRYAGSDKTLHQKDFIKAAEADGYKFATRVEHKADLARVVAEFIAFDGPAFLEVMIDPRSEDQTSELQSLMCISYAVFFLNKHKNTKLN